MSLLRSKTVKNISGVVCLYKPVDIGITTFKQSFGNKLCSELNALDQPDELDEHNYIEFSHTDRQCIDIKPSYENNILVRGPRFNSDNINLYMTNLGKKSSGVCIAGINGGGHQVLKILKNKPIMVSHVKGKLGEATQYYYKGEKIVSKARYERVKKKTMEDLISYMEAAHLKTMYANLGIDLRSQEAYELAVNGLLKFKMSYAPCFYSIKCIYFHPPEFTLEITSLHSTESHFLRLIHILGLKLRVFAHCTGIRCIRFGQFTVQHSLVKNEWTVENLYNNMELCKKLIFEKPSIASPYVSPLSEKQPQS